MEGVDHPCNGSDARAHDQARQLTRFLRQLDLELRPLSWLPALSSSHFPVGATPAWSTNTPCVRTPGNLVGMRHGVFKGWVAAGIHMQAGQQGRGDGQGTDMFIDLASQDGRSCVEGRQCNPDAHPASNLYVQRCRSPHRMNRLAKLLQAGSRVLTQSFTRARARAPALSHSLSDE